MLTWRLSGFGFSHFGIPDDPNPSVNRQLRSVAIRGPSLTRHVASLHPRPAIASRTPRRASPSRTGRLASAALGVSLWPHFTFLCRRPLPSLLKFTMQIFVKTLTGARACCPHLDVTIRPRCFCAVLARRVVSALATACHVARSAGGVQGRPSLSRWSPVTPLTT